MASLKKSLVLMVLLIFVLSSWTQGFEKKELNKSIMDVEMAKLSTASSGCIAKKGKDRPDLPPLVFWTVGNWEDVIQRFTPNIYKKLDELRENEITLDCFLLALAESPLGEPEILEKCSMPLSRLHHLTTTLQSIKLLTRFGQDKLVTTVPVITDRQMKGIRASLKPLARKVALFLKNKVSRLKSTYEKGKVVNDPSWEKVAHLFIDKFIIDATFHSAINILEREKGIKEYYSKSQKQIPAFFLEHGPNFSNFGVNWYSFKKGSRKREVYILHGALFNRIEIPFNRHRKDEHFSSLIHRIAADGSLQDLTKADKETLKILGWIDDNWLLVPMIHAESAKNLLQDMEKIGYDAAQVVFNNYFIILNSFEKSPYAGFMDGGGDYIQVCYHVLFSVIIEELIKGGILPHIPEIVPEHLGVFITMGSVFE